MTEVELFPGHVARVGMESIPLEDVTTLSGLELMQRVIAGTYAAPTIAERMNFALVEATEGRVVFQGMPSNRHLNPLGGVHGGWAATILDSALGCCVHTLLAPGEAYSTAEMKINYTRPITPQTGIVTAEGKIVHKGRTLAVSEARLTDQNGKLLAFGTETCSIFPLSRIQR
jgi:uncharacterized protein (TIGR00369 family)